MRNLRGAAYVGKHGCEHQDFMQPVKIVAGEGPDAGTVTFQIGSTHITFNSTEALIHCLVQLPREQSVQPVTLAI